MQTEREIYIRADKQARYGIVADKVSRAGIPLVIHNIGAGP